MTSDSQAPKARGGKDRKLRLAEELRANLQRRKAQTRSRRIGEADQRPEGIETIDKQSDIKTGGQQEKPATTA